MRNQKGLSLLAYKEWGFPPTGFLTLEMSIGRLYNTLHNAYVFTHNVAAE